MTLYALEHPEADGASRPMQVAGVEYALRWYEQALAKGGRHNEFLDGLLAKRDRGELVGWFETTVHLD